MANKPSWIVIHHTASGRDFTTPEAVNRYHRDKNWDTPPRVARALMSSLGSYIQYHLFISADGVVTRCAWDDEIRWHVGPQINQTSIAICLAGWFDPDHDKAPTKEQLSSLKRLISEYSLKYKIPKERIVGHHFFATKSCPGHLFNLKDLLKSIDLYMSPGSSKKDPALLSRLVGRILIRPESRGEAYFVTENGLISIGTSFLDYTKFFLNLRARKVPHTGISETDFKRLPILDE